MAEKLKAVRLTVEQQELLKNQILIVLADYQTCSDPYAFATGAERIRLEVADRIMNNLRVVASH